MPGEIEMKPQYSIERHRHGWLVCAAPGQAGVPLDALREITRMIPNAKTAVIAIGVGHHLRFSRYRPEVVMAIATKAGATAWEQEITELLKGRLPEEQWWLGVDVGKSSAAIFAALCPLRWHREADEYAQGATPGDAADFGRCTRLLELFPGWRDRLGEVYSLYPGTAWTRIIPRWGELEAATTERQNEILQECNQFPGMKPGE